MLQEHTDVHAPCGSTFHLTWSGCVKGGQPRRRGTMGGYVGFRVWCRGGIWKWKHQEAWRYRIQRQTPAEVLKDSALRVLELNLKQKLEAVQDKRAYLVKVNYHNSFKATGAGVAAKPHTALR
eukprot:3103285-Amphidinium_carterae.1